MGLTERMIVALWLVASRVLKTVTLLSSEAEGSLTRPETNVSQRHGTLLLAGPKLWYQWKNIGDGL